MCERERVRESERESEGRDTERWREKERGRERVRERVLTYNMPYLQFNKFEKNAKNDCMTHFY